MHFTVIEDAIVILRSKGVFKQVKAYKRNGFIYAAYGSGFIRIIKTGAIFGTSVPNVNVESFDLGFEPKYAAYGYMVEPNHPEAR